MKKITLTLCILFIAICSSVKAQDLHFAQVQESPMLINPANTGFFPGYFRAIAQYRNQWASMGKPYQTMGLAVDGGLFRNRKKSAYLGLGLTVFNDKAGAANMGYTQINFNISGLIKVSKKAVFSAGVYGGSIMSNGNYNTLNYASQYNGTEIDPNLPTGESVNFHKYTATDVGAGVAYEFTNTKPDHDRDDVFSIKVGLAAYHLNNPRQDFGTGTGYRLPTKYVFHANVRFDIPGSNWAILPNVTVFRQATAMEYNIGTYVKYRFKNGTKTTGLKYERGLAIGAYYRVFDALIPQLILDMGGYAIGVSYDANISGYKQVSKTVGGFEVSLRYNMLADALFKRKSEYGSK